MARERNSRAAHRLATTAAALAVATALAHEAAPARAAPARSLPMYASYGAPRIHVKGTTHIALDVSKANGVTLSGQVTDDASSAVPVARVALSISPERDASAGVHATPPSAIALATAAPEACEAGGRLVLETSTRLSLASDVTGRFCVRLKLPPARYVAHAEAAESALFDGAAADLPFDSSRDDVALRFDPERPIWSLDSVDRDVEVVATSGDRASPAARLPVSLAGEHDTPYGAAVTDESGRARLRLAPETVREPGMHPLRASFGGDATFGPSAVETMAEATTVVRVVATDASEGVLPAASPADGVLLQVVASPGCRFRGCAAEPTGIVEARVGGTVVGAATLDHGAARFSVTFAWRHDASAPMTLTYVPDSPWFRAGDPADVVLPVVAPHSSSGLATILAGIAALACFVGIRVPARWRWPDRRARKPRASVQAAIHVVRPERGAGLHGHVVDAHDRTPIAGATLRIERPGFQRSELVGQCTSDADGRFALDEAPVKTGDRIVVVAAFHDGIAVPVPAAGEVDVSLVQRRRQILERLIAWTRGNPDAGFDRAPEPTPAHVRRVAAPASRVARWAEAVELAAFGPLPVDAARQAEVDSLAVDDAAETSEPSGALRARSPLDGAR